MSKTLRFTAAEAAFVLQEPIKSVKKALYEGPVLPVLLHRAGSPVRAIDASDLFYLYAVRTLRDELTPKARGVSLNPTAALSTGKLSRARAIVGEGAYRPAMAVIYHDHEPIISGGCL
jgi:hypothetical protein